MLREPPPDLLMMSAVLSDEPALVVTETEPKSIETDVDGATNTEEPDTTKKVPIHVMQQSFSMKKRLKKAHIQTLETVYRRTKRPTVSESLILIWKIVKESRCLYIYEAKHDLTY